MITVQFLYAQSSIIKNKTVDFPVWNKETAKDDWLLGEIKEKAKLYRSHDNNRIVLANGLLARVFSVKGNGATIALENLMTGNNELRAVRPEAEITLNSVDYNIGGMVG